MAAVWAAGPEPMMATFVWGGAILAGWVVAVVVLFRVCEMVELRPKVGRIEDADERKGIRRK